MAFTKVAAAGISTGNSLTIQELNTVGVITAATVQVGSATTIHTTGIDLGSGNITSHNINSTGIITAAAAVITGDLEVQGSTTTLDTIVTEVDKLEVAANNTNVAVAVTQSGTGDILRLYDGSTQAVTVTDTGEIGIGINSPSQLLHVNNSNSNAIIQITSSDTRKARVRFGDQTSDNGGEVQYDNADDSLSFKAAGSEALRITSGGNVGIGITNPSSDLEISQDGSQKIRIYKNASASTPASNGNTTTVIDFVKANSGSATEIGAIRWRNTDVDSSNTEYTAASIASFNDGSVNDGNLVFNIANNGTQAEALRINSSGNVGIGTDNPIAKLHVHNPGTGSGDHAYAYFTTGDTGSDASSGLTIGVAANYDASITYREVGNLVFGTSGSERLRITSTGIVGIGTNNPNFGQSTPISTYDPKFGVNGSVMIGNLSTTASDRSELQFFRRNGAAGQPIDTHDMGRIAWYGSSNDSDNSNLAWSIGVNPDGGNWVSGVNRKGYMTFNNHDGEKVRITSGGDLAVGATGDIYGPARLNIRPDNRQTQFDASDGNTWHDVVIKQNDTNASGGNAAGLAFEISTGAYHNNAGTGIAAIKDSNSNDFGCHLAFITRPHAAVSEERLRITSAGDVGIGTAVPITSSGFGNLSLAKTNGGQLELKKLSSGRAHYIWGDDNLNVAAAYNGSGDLRVLTNGNNERLRITSSGDVGIGSQTPTHKLDIVGGASQQLQITGIEADLWLKSTGPGGTYRILGSTGQNTHRFRIYDETNSLDRLNILSDGKIFFGNNTQTALGSASKDYCDIDAHCSGPMSIGSNGPSSLNTTLKLVGRKVVNWYWYGYVNTGNTYAHLRTSLWGGGSPHGQIDYIMGGFRIEGYQYTGSATSVEYIMFHNWNGALAGYSRYHHGTYNPGNTVYVDSTGYVTIRLVNSTYKGFSIDLMQQPWYPVRDIRVTNVINSNSTAI